MYWYLDSIVDAGGTVTFDMQQECLPLITLPGYCVYTGTLSATDPATGNEVQMTIVNGLITDYAGQISGIDFTTGENVTATIAAQVVTDYDGLLGLLDPATGDTIYVRVDSDGKIKN